MQPNPVLERRIRFVRPRPALLLIALVATGATAFAQHTPARDLARMSLEDLMSLEVTSVAKKEQPWLDAPQAIEVVTGEDLRRSGVTSLAEALRLVPGLSVAQMDANKWAIGSRGFNDRFSNKLLVLIDGRSVYSPLFSGVFWDVQDLLLEDVDRIEVVRGPGATLWGANAVSGVINIITKTAAETLGGYAEASLEALDRSDGPAYGGFTGGLRYGLRLSPTTHARAYAKRVVHSDLEDESGDPAADAWSGWRGGFRLDREADRQELMVQGDLHTLDAGGRALIPLSVFPYQEVAIEDGHASGGHLLARWQRDVLARSQLAVQSYYAQTWREDSIHVERRRTFDLDLQYRTPVRTRGEIVAGVGYRVTSDKAEGRSGRAMDPPERQDQLVSGFVQGEAMLAGDRLRLMAGTRLEHNDYSGFEIGPGARLLAKPVKRVSLWASVARAVRTPSRVEHDMRAQFRAVVAGETAYLGFLEGDSLFQSEKLVAYEIGGRGELTTRLSVDAALHYDRYHDLRTFEPDLGSVISMPEEGYTQVSFAPRNQMDGRTYGGELSARWNPLDGVRLVASYTYLKMDLTPRADSRDPWAKEAEGYIPHHQMQLRAYSDLPHHTQLNACLYLVDERPAESIPAYARLDVRFAWLATPRLELSLGGRNLTERVHRETALQLLSRTAYVPRSLYAKATWRF